MAGPKNKAAPVASSLSTDDFASLASVQIGAMPTEVIDALSTQDITAIETTDIGVLTTGDIMVLSTDQLSALSTDAMAALDTASVMVLVTSDLGALSTAAVLALETSQIVALSTEDVGAMNIGAAAVQVVEDVASPMLDAITDDEHVTLGINTPERPEPTMIEQLVAASRQAQQLGDYTMHAEIEGLIDSLQSLKMRLAASSTLPVALVDHLKSLL